MMNKSIFSLILCALLFAGCTNKDSLLIQVVDENNVPIYGATIEFLTKNYETDLEGYCKLSKVSTKYELITVSKFGYEDVRKLVRFNADGKTVIVRLVSTDIDLNGPRSVQMERLLKRLERFDPNDKSAKMVALGTWDAEFPGGVKGLQKYINENVMYPESAIDRGEQGKVFMEFVVEKDGSISSIKVKKGLSKDLNKESIRVVKSMPPWIPGYVDGLPARTRCRLPIVYTLQ